MDIQDFSFETNTLSFTFIEEEIAVRCNMGYSDSSSNPWRIKEGSQNMRIYCTKGSINCRVMAYKSKETDKYVIEVSGISVTQKRR